MKVVWLKPLVAVAIIFVVGVALEAPLAVVLVLVAEVAAEAFLMAVVKCSHSVVVVGFFGGTCLGIDTCCV